MKIQKAISIFLVFVMCMFALSSCDSNRSAEDPKGKVNKESQENTMTAKKETQGNTCGESQEDIAAADKALIVGYADYPNYASLNDLKNKSDYIIYGKVLAKSYEWLSLRIENNSDNEYLNPGGDVDNDLTLVTVFEVSIIKNYKTASSDGDVIKVLMIGGETEDAIYRIEGSPEIKAEETYIFFLSESAIVENGAWLLNDTQSLYFTDGNSISGVTEDGFELSFEILDSLTEE